METTSIFVLELLISIAVCAIIVSWYVWPRLIKLPVYDALIPLVFVHVFRYIGMTLMVPYMFDQKLPSDYIHGAAYGDLLASALALASIFALRNKSGIAIPLVWVFNLMGFLDLLNGVRSLVGVNAPDFNLGTVWYLFTFYAPMVIISHLLIFYVLIKSKSWGKQVLAS